MNGFDFASEIRVIFGANTVDRVGEFAQGLGASRVLVVTDPGMIEARYPQRVQKALAGHSIQSFIFSNVSENPSTKEVEAGTEFAKQHQPVDLIIGLGGGSPMDCAKGINFLLTNGGKMEDYWGFNKAGKPMLPSIGIPTTAGTGSEAQSYALISQEGTHRKMACGDVKARFKIVILDPVLTTTAPRTVTAISGIDAIAHAVETYVTKTRNALTQMYSRQAWELLNKNFETVLQEPQDLQARSEMLIGAHFAGVAIEYSMLGAAHACANPLTAQFGIAHGVAVGLMLPAVIRFNQETVADEYKHLSADLYARVCHLKSLASLPHTLRECKIEKQMLPQLAQDAATQWTGKHNPRPLTEADFLDLYASTY